MIFLHHCLWYYGFNSLDAHSKIAENNVENFLRPHRSCFIRYQSTHKILSNTSQQSHASLLLFAKVYLQLPDDFFNY